MITKDLCSWDREAWEWGAELYNNNNIYFSTYPINYNSLKITGQNCEAIY